MYLCIGKSQLGTLLICHNQKAGSHAHPQKTACNKECRRFHLGCQTAHPKPCLPLILQFIGYRHDLRLMLSEERILTLDNTGVICDFFLFCCLYQGMHDIDIRYSRILDRCIFPASPFHTDSTAGDHYVTSTYILLHATASTHTDKGMRTCL